MTLTRKFTVTAMTMKYVHPYWKPSKRVWFKKVLYMEGLFDSLFVDETCEETMRVVDARDRYINDY